MTKHQRYNQYKEWQHEERRTIQEVHDKLHELYNEDNLDELRELGCRNDLMAYHK